MKNNMKKKAVLALATLMFSASLTFVSPRTDAIAAPKRSTAEQKAINAALKDAGLTEKDITNIKIQYEVEDGISVYDIDFYVNGGKYSYDINAKSGDIVSKEFEKKKAPKKKVTNKKKTGSFISKAKAKEIALKHSQLTEKEVTFVKVKREKENKIYIYDVEFHTDTTEYSYEINAKTGKILEFSNEAHDNDWDD